MVNFDTTLDHGRDSDLARSEAACGAGDDSSPSKEGAVAPLLKQLQWVLRDAASSPEDRLKRVDLIVNAAAPSDGSVTRTQLSAGRVLFKGGLASWQVKRLHLFIAERLPGVIRSGDLARVVCLTPHHFCRVFRVSLKVTPQAFIMRKRLEKACAMMKSSRATLGQIAIENGFADQAHFNRVFRKYMNCSPGAWRRMDTACPD